MAKTLTCKAVPCGAEESIRAQVISLDGLLDYDEGDTEEATMELSLAAEALQEMLSRDYGDAILQALLTERRGTSHIWLSRMQCPYHRPPRCSDTNLSQLSVQNVLRQSSACLAMLEAGRLQSSELSVGLLRELLRVWSGLTRQCG